MKIERFEQTLYEVVLSPLLDGIMAMEGPDWDMPPLPSIIKQKALLSILIDHTKWHDQ